MSSPLGSRKATEMSSRVWLINPDAEQELLHHVLHPSRPYQCPAALSKTLEDIHDKFQPLTEHDELLIVGSRKSSAPIHGRPTLLSFWCPTHHVQKWAQRTWGVHMHAPSMDLLARCNDKLTVSQFDACIQERAQVCSVADLQRLIIDRGWRSCDPRGQSVGAGARASVRLKRRFGQAGRGQRRVNEFLSADDLRFVQDSAKFGGLIAEPELTIAKNWSMHGVVTPTMLLLGEPCSFTNDRFSSPESEVRRDEGNPSLTNAMRVAAGDVAATLQQWGYFGPFGLDFVACADERLALVDINARFTLGFSVGMGQKRSTALDLIDRCALRA